jgi:heme-degrading monooxygenase HmoA
MDSSFQASPLLIGYLRPYRDRIDRGEEAMHARVSFYEVASGGDVAAAVKGFEDAMEPVRQMEGNQGVALLVDRNSGKAITITYWDSEDHLQSSAEQANKLRQEASDTGGLTIQGVESYEVALESR